MPSLSQIFYQQHEDSQDVYNEIWGVLRTVGGTIAVGVSDSIEGARDSTMEVWEKYNEIFGNNI